MKIFKYISVLVIFFSVFGCKDYLDKAPDDQLTIDMVFNDKDKTEQWLSNVYAGIPDPYVDLMRGIGYDCMGDDMAPSPGWVNFGWPPLVKQVGNWNSTTTQSIELWTALPQRIREAQLFILNAKVLKSQADEGDNAQINLDIMKNEARFLIAYYNWLLVEAFGPIPYYDGVTEVTASVDQLMIGQRPYDEVVSKIEQQLTDLATKLPVKQAKEEKYGHATSLMCLAVKARMLLFAASPLVNGNPDYADFKNKKGELLFNPTYDANKWVKAVAASKALIDLAKANGYDLYRETNADGTIDPFLSYQNMMFKREYDGNKEILFARPGSSTGEYDRNAQPRGASGFGGMGVTQTLVDAFFMKNGLPITDAASGYSEKGFSTAAERRTTKWIECQGENETGTTRQVTLPGTFNMYCNREARFYISVLYNRGWVRRVKRAAMFMLNEADGGPTYDSPQAGYLLRKKVHPSYTGSDVYRPGILYRLGEAYLNYAEALNEVDFTANKTEILTYVNLIRERAGIPGYGTGAGQIAVPADQAAMRTAIRRERRVELNCEDGIRWDDIRRWKLGETLLNGPFYGMNVNGSVISDDATKATSYFVRTVYQTRVFTKKMYWYPVPQAQIDINPNLVQNPFW